MEQWKTISDSQGNYEISSYGRVRNKNTGKILKPMLKNSGYYEVNLAYGIRKWVSIHRLVAMEFVENPYGYKYVNHKDEQKTNNYFENLEWCTAKYNVNYGKGYQARCHGVVQKNTDGSIVKEWNSIKEAAENIGINYQRISSVCRGERKTARGFIWEYAEGSHDRKSRQQYIQEVKDRAAKTAGQFIGVINGKRT